jgi:predicted amidohydrolase YtcJ
MYDGARSERSGRDGAPPPGRKLWRFLTVGAATAAAVASTTMLAVAFGGGHDEHSPASARPLGAADMVLHHGKISTVDKDNTTVEAIAIRDGEILATGSNKKVMRLIGRGTKVINLKGRRVLPGLIDGHLHGMREGYHCWTQGVRLDLITSRAQALAAYADKAAELPDGKWIWTTFGGWSVTQLDDPRIFTFDELTAAAPNNPVWITGGGFTGPRVNQAALDALGLTAASPGVQVDADGKPTGLLTGAASQAANAAILAQLDALGIDAEAKCLADFIAEANSRGLTAWKDAGGNTAPWSTIGAINEGLHSQEPAMQLYRDGGLNARIAYHDMANAYTAGALEREKSLTENAVGFLGDDMFRYLGQGEDMMATMADYNEYAKYAASKRLSVETHVGGPIDAILDGFEMADAIYPVGTLKWRIAHPENGQPSDAQLARGRELGIGWALTFSSVRTGGTGPRYHTTMENSDHMCLGSDAMNVAAWAPFQSLWFVTSGHTLIPGTSGVPENERLSRLDALRHMTVECGWFIDQENRVGSLEPGRHADLIVLSDDYFKVPVDDIKDLRSNLTIVGGRIVHADGAFTNVG